MGQKQDNLQEATTEEEMLQVEFTKGRDEDCCPSKVSKLPNTLRSPGISTDGGVGKWGQQGLLQSRAGRGKKKTNQNTWKKQLCTTCQRTWTPPKRRADYLHSVLGQRCEHPPPPETHQSKPLNTETDSTKTRPLPAQGPTHQPHTGCKADGRMGESRRASWQL